MACCQEPLKPLCIGSAGRIVLEKINYFSIYESSEYSSTSLKVFINIAYFLNIKSMLYELLSELETDRAAPGININYVENLSLRCSQSNFMY